jgi:hypothetical protein
MFRFAGRRQPTFKVRDFFKKTHEEQSWLTSLIAFGLLITYGGWAIDNVPDIFAFMISVLIAMILTRLYVLPLLFGMRLRRTVAACVDGTFMFWFGLYTLNNPHPIAGRIFAILLMTMAGALMFGLALTDNEEKDQ